MCAPEAAGTGRQMHCERQSSRLPLCTRAFMCIQKRKLILFTVNVDRMHSTPFRTALYVYNDCCVRERWTLALCLAARSGNFAPSRRVRVTGPASSVVRIKGPLHKSCRLWDSISGFTAEAALHGDGDRSSTHWLSPWVATRAVAAVTRSQEPGAASRPPTGCRVPRVCVVLYCLSVHKQRVCQV